MSKPKLPLDVHGLDLLSAIKVIKSQINYCYLKGVSTLYVNHGYNTSRKIKSWCLNEGKLEPLVIKVEVGDNEGITIFYIKTKFID